MAIELRQLRSFVEVAQAGSFSRAASLLSIAQPALSRQIRQLEQAMNARLFHRNGRGVVPTLAGELLLGHARDILNRASQAQRELAALQGHPTGTVVLGVPPSVSTMFLTPLVVQVRDRYPGVKLHVMEGFSGTVLDWVQIGRVDVAIIYNVRPCPLILAETLLVEDLFLVRKPDRQDPRSVIRCEDLAEIPVVLPAKPHGLRLLCESAMGQHGYALDVRFEIDSLPIMKELAREGVVPTILPYGAVAREVEAGQLEALRIVEPNLSRTMMLATATNRPIDASVRAIIGAIQSVVADLGGTQQQDRGGSAAAYGA